MGARWARAGRPHARCRSAFRCACLRRSRPTANPGDVPGEKPTPRRTGRVLPIVDVVRRPRPRRQVRPAGELRTRACAAWPRPTGHPCSGRRCLGEPNPDHARASSRTARYGACGSLLLRWRLRVEARDVRADRHHLCPPTKLRVDGFGRRPRPPGRVALIPRYQEEACLRVRWCR
jgi:hypothetical protein